MEVLPATVPATLHVHVADHLEALDLGRELDLLVAWPWPTSLRRWYARPLSCLAWSVSPWKTIGSAPTGMSSAPAASQPDPRDLPRRTASPDEGSDLVLGHPPLDHRLDPELRSAPSCSSTVAGSARPASRERHQDQDRHRADQPERHDRSRCCCPPTGATIMPTMPDEADNAITSVSPTGARLGRTVQLLRRLQRASGL